MKPNGIAALLIILVIDALVIVARAPAVAARDGEECASPLDDWSIERGTLARGMACGSFLATTDGVASRFSYGMLRWREPVTVPYELSVTWRRLGPEPGKPLELHLLGAILLVKDDYYGVYVDDAKFSADGWQPLPGYRTHAENTVAVEQRADRLVIRVNGAVVREWPFVASAPSGTIGAGFKGAGGFRSRVAFRDVRVTRGAAGAAAQGQ